MDEHEVISTSFQMTNRLTFLLTFASGLIVALLAATLLPNIINMMFSATSPERRVKRLTAFGFGVGNQMGGVTTNTMPAVLKSRDVIPTGGQYRVLCAIYIT